MRRWNDIRCGCERQGDTKSSAATDAHPKQSTKQWRQVASIGESSLSRTQFSFAKEGGVCLRTSAPSLCPSQTLPESQSPLVLYAMALGFLATYFPLILFWALTCSPVCCLPYGSSQDFPPWSLTFSPEPTGKPHLPLVVWGISSHLLVTSDSKFKVEWTVWLQNSGSLSSSLSVIPLTCAEQPQLHPLPQATYVNLFWLTRLHLPTPLLSIMHCWIFTTRKLHPIAFAYF